MTTQPLEIYQEMKALFDQLEHPNIDDNRINRVLEKQIHKYSLIALWGMPANDRRFFELTYWRDTPPQGEVSTHNIKGSLHRNKENNYYLTLSFYRDQRDEPTYKYDSFKYLDLNDKFFEQFLKELCSTMVPDFIHPTESKKTFVKYLLNHPTDAIPILDLVDELIEKYLDLYFETLPKKEASKKRTRVNRTLKKIAKIKPEA